MFRLSVVLGVVLASVAAAQQEDWTFPNPLQGENVAAPCQNFDAQVQASDPQAMQYIVGVWEGTGVIPATPGLMPGTPFQYRATNLPDGSFTAEHYGCFTMQSEAIECPTSASRPSAPGSASAASATRASSSIRSVVVPSIR